MADKYFRIKEGCPLYEDYFSHEADKNKIASAFTEVREKYGIETHEFYPSKKCFHIVPTSNDSKKFSDSLKKTSYGEFKKNSEISKAWIELVKDIEHMEKPRLIFYFVLLGYHWKERLFDIDGVLYCSIESDGEISTPDFAEELKASEFYKIVEDYEERNKKMKLYFYHLSQPLGEKPRIEVEECEVEEKPKTYRRIDKFPKFYCGHYVKKENIGKLAGYNFNVVVLTERDNARVAEIFKEKLNADIALSESNIRYEKKKMKEHTIL